MINVVYEKVITVMGRHTETGQGHRSLYSIMAYIALICSQIQFSQLLI